MAVTGVGPQTALKCEGVREGPDHTRWREREGHWPQVEVEVGAGARPCKGKREGGALATSASGCWGQTMQGGEIRRGVGHECKWELGPGHARGREREGHWP